MIRGIRKKYSKLLNILSIQKLQMSKFLLVLLKHVKRMNGFV